MRIEKKDEIESQESNLNTVPEAVIKETDDMAYPCTGCENEEACYFFKTCPSYLSWFRHQWQGIREAAKKFK